MKSLKSLALAALLSFAAAGAWASDAADEFIRAINRFKERTGRAFPTWSEVLQILRDLGYEKQT